MKNIIARLLERFNRRNIECEVEDELHFHLEMLIEEHIRQGLSPEEARREALKRFGNVAQIKNQCVEISSRSQPLFRILKWFLIVVFLGGVSARIFSDDIYGKQIGNMLMIIAALSWLLLYIRGLRYSNFVPKEENSSPLGLAGIQQMPFNPGDEKEFTPLERIITDD